MDETVAFCPDPRDDPPDAPVPQSFDEAGELWETSRAISEKGVERPMSVVFTAASEWAVQGSTLAVRADISAIIDRYGPECTQLRLRPKWTASRLCSPSIQCSNEPGTPRSQGRVPEALRNAPGRWSRDLWSPGRRPTTGSGFNADSSGSASPPTCHRLRLNHVCGLSSQVSVPWHDPPARMRSSQLRRERAHSRRAD